MCYFKRRKVESIVEKEIWGIRATEKHARKKKEKEKKGLLRDYKHRRQRLFSSVGLNQCTTKLMPNPFLLKLFNFQGPSCRISLNFKKQKG